MVTIEQTNELHKFLQGELPEGYAISDPAKLTANQASSVIYFLQEQYGLIPDTYEMCDECSEYFDRNCEGISTKTGFACECCRDGYSACPLCDEHFKRSDTPENTVFVLSTDDAEDQKMKPGLYKAVRFPVYTSDMFSEWISKDAVTLIKECKEYDETGFICQECFEKEESSKQKIL